MSDYSVQRFRGAFALVWHEDGKRRRRRLYSEDRPSAEAEARRIWQQGDDSPWTVGRIVNGYIASQRLDAKPSLKRREDAWKAMHLFWDRVDPDLVDEDMCRAYEKQRDAGPSTIRYELLLISTAIGWGRKVNATTAKPKMWLPPQPERKVKALSHAQFEKLFAAIKAPHAQLYALLGLFTMARPTAILELTWGQIDFENGLIDLNPPGRRQTRKRRPTVPMNVDLREALEKAYEARQTKFVIERGAQPVANIKKAFQAASARSGVKATPYTLRHTGAVWAATNGVSMAKLAQYMGHDDDSTTQKHYARFQPDHLTDVASAVQRVKK